MQVNGVFEPKISNLWMFNDSLVQPSLKWRKQK